MRQLMACALATLVLGACSSPTAQRGVAFEGEPVEIEIAYGEAVTIEGAAARIRFAGVEQDSRCPADVACVWQGTAGIELILSGASGPGERTVLHTGQEPRAVEFAGLAVTLLDVAPYPERQDTPIPSEAYRARLRIESLDGGT